MGMTREVALARVPGWPAVAAALTARGVAVHMRMIDGALAFPDAAPDEGWGELRVACDGEMVTVRRAAGGVQIVAWGNAGEAQRRLWEALAQAFAEAGA